MFIIWKNRQIAKLLGLYDRNWLFWPDLAQIWPNLVHLTYFGTGAGSKKLMYALTVVIIFRNVLLVKVSGLYFQNWLFRPNLAPIWPNLVHLKTCKGCHHVSGALEVVFTFKNINRNQILGQSDSQKLKFYTRWNLPFRCLYLSRRSVNMVFFCFPGLHFINT